jgi:hypothetical protein
MSNKKNDSLNDVVAVAYMDERGRVSYFETTIAKLLGVKS